MKIKIERSGGFAGIPLNNEVDAKDLPLSLLHTAKKIVETKKISSSLMKSRRKGSADQYSYKISIQDGTTLKVIDCNQHDLSDDLKLLVGYIEKNSSGNFRK